MTHRRLNQYMSLYPVLRRAAKSRISDDAQRPMRMMGLDLTIDLILRDAVYIPSEAVAPWRR